MKSLLLPTCLMIACSNVMAADWIRLDKNNDPAIYIDQSSLSYDEGILRVWIKSKHKLPKKLESGKSYDTMRSLHKIECKSRRMADVQYALYKGEALVDSYIYLPHESELQEVVPDSNGDFIVTHFCKNLVE